MQINGLKLFHFIPYEAKETGAARCVQPRGQGGCPGPVAVLEHLHPRARTEILVYIVTQIFHIISAQPVRNRSRGCGGLNGVQSLDQRLGCGSILMVAVCIVGVGQYAGHVGFRKQAQADGKFRRKPFRLACGEARDKPGGFFTAFGVDFFQKIMTFTAKVGQQRSIGVTGER